jgi:hypothetical protein
MSDVRTVYQRARIETAKLLGYGDNLDGLSAEQSTRLDLAVALRIALDDQAAKVLRGESADVSKLLSASEALSKLLPPAVLASPPPAANAPDPREVMWQTYLSMRRRGELAESHLSPQQRLEAARAKVAAIEAEIAAGSPAITPPTSDIVPPGEIGECYAGMRPGPDDPPKRRPVVIEGKATPAPAAPAADVVDLRAGYSDGPAEPWRDYLNRNFDPWADNRR